jgi:hypothetical protein
MKPPIIRVSLAFANGMPDDTFITFARTVSTLLYAEPAFTGIPVPAATLDAATTAFYDAKAAQASGGKAATAEKNNKRAALETLLKELALYVQVASNNNLAMLLSSGFESVSTNRARLPLSKPKVLRVVTGMTGQALVTLSTENNVRGCEVKVAELDENGTPGEFRPVVFSTSSRNIAVNELTPGKMYVIMGRTLGGATTYSDWSDQVAQRAA